MRFIDIVSKKALAIVATVLGLVAPCCALDKEMSLVTGQPLGELVVAGRLSVDLHAEFMVSREYGTETVLNWYNCGYSGGGGENGAVTTVGGNFGDFGFQVPFAQRQERYPHAVTVDQVRAVRFDGNDFLKANFAVESSIAGAQNMAIEVWFRAAKPDRKAAILGWQSRDGKETSGTIGYPANLAGSDKWRHLVVNCTPDTEDWYLDGARVRSGHRATLVEAGHVMVLGGASAARPSFQGALVAVRLHDQAMTQAEIARNFQGGPMLGTALHNWWRMEPDKWWVRESEHFRHAVDKAEMAAWTEQQRKDFENRLPAMFDMAELLYHTYTERLAMRCSLVSVKPEERGDGIKYKTPIQPSGGSWMGWDGHFGWACQGAGHINPHELAHGWHAMTGNMQGNYWETFANFPQTYNGIYQTIPVIIAECSAFPSSGRTYYHDRLIFEHLAQTPEYGPMFTSKLWYDGPTPTDATPFPWITFNRLHPYPDRTLADEYARMVMRNVTWDYTTFQEHRPGQTGNTPHGNDGVVSEEMRSADPASGRWEKCGELRVTGDPALFFDDDGRAWLYHGLGKPTKVFEMDTKDWREILGSEVQLRAAITNIADFVGGYERGRREIFAETDTSALLDRFAILPCQEAAWMTKRNGRYYLQYATPGTVTQWYCDVALEGDSPTGPFQPADDSPASLKAGGFMGSAGHSCVFQDKLGHWWRVTTMWIGVYDLFERRLGLFPVKFDAQGRMSTDTALGDYPHGRKWFGQSFNKKCTASSSLTDHPPGLAADENCRTWWSAQTGNTGEWFQLDLGKTCRVHAVQVNFAEQDIEAAGDDYHAYRLLASDDGADWRPLVDKSAAKTCTPHDFVELPAAVTARFLKLENVHTPRGGKFALRDLRVFGHGHGAPPPPVSDIRIARHTDDDRNVTIRWSPAANADGYLLRFNDCCLQMQGGPIDKLTFHALTRGVKYRWRLDAFNDSGLTAGANLQEK